MQVRCAIRAGTQNMWRSKEWIKGERIYHGDLTTIDGSFSVKGSNKLCTLCL